VKRLGVVLQCRAQRRTLRNGDSQQGAVPYAEVAGLDVVFKLVWADTGGALKESAPRRFSELGANLSKSIPQLEVLLRETLQKVIDRFVLF
jgi:hypothetical protein